MQYKEYMDVQVGSSVWTEEDDVAMSLVRDSVREFRKYISENHRVLEIGCGDGYALKILESLGIRDTIGTDINRNKLRRAHNHNHSVCVGDVHRLGFRSEAFDAIYCTHTLEHTYNGYVAVQEIFRVLRPGGIAALIVPDHSRLYGDTFVGPGDVTLLENRSVRMFEDRVFERIGDRSPWPRNQFPFTMRLLLAVVQTAGFEVQWAQRIEREGSELWCLASKPGIGKDFVTPLLSRAWREDGSKGNSWGRVIRKIFRRIGKLSKDRLTQG